ncbi:hypothetical protein [Mycolicibacterium nivoides]|uniref:Major tail protein n=1 Tax=Mycolicibacterium nivoides TaxID=2487344 RepID=A0ABW9LAM8_9MYCO
MPEATINPDATLIPDKAEVWLLLKSDVTDIDDLIPESPTEDLGALGWLFSGLIDDKKGIPLDPSGEVKEYDAFGHPNFRTKFKKGKLKSGFTALEDNAVTRKIVLPGSAPNKRGAPRDVQVYVLYRFVDEDRAIVWVALRPALAELKGHGGIIDGELSYAELTVHHSPDAAGDVFQVVDGLPITKVFTIGSGVTAYTATVDGEPTASITTMTSAALQTALRALPNVGPTGVAVSGNSGGPLTAVFSVPVSVVSASGTGGTVTVA